MDSLNRRAFISKTGLATLAASGLGSPFLRPARAAESGPNEKLRIGLIGCGGMGQGDLACFMANPDVECAVICDVDETRSAKIGRASCRERV